MLFNSINFLFFFPIIFSTYWILGKKRRKLQNLFILISSYFFYSCWDWRILFLLLLFSTSLDYFSGIKMEKFLWLAFDLAEKNTRKKLLKQI